MKLAAHPLATWRRARGLSVRVLVAAAGLRVDGWNPRFAREMADLLGAVEAGLPIAEFHRERLSKFLAPIVGNDLAREIHGAPEGGASE